MSPALLICTRVLVCPVSTPTHTDIQGAHIVCVLVCVCVFVYIVFTPIVGSQTYVSVCAHVSVCVCVLGGRHHRVLACAPSASVPLLHVSGVRVSVCAPSVPLRVCALIPCRRVRATASLSAHAIAFALMQVCARFVFACNHCSPSHVPLCSPHSCCVSLLPAA